MFLSISAVMKRPSSVQAMVLAFADNILGVENQARFGHRPPLKIGGERRAFDQVGKPSAPGDEPRLDRSVILSITSFKYFEDRVLHCASRPSGS
jgi:hypothetical protein